MEENLVILITASGEEEGARIAKELVDGHLAACVNLVPGIRSFFFWEGRTQDAREVLLICKTRRDRFDALVARVKGLHSYTVPEIIALPVVAGAEDYLRWIGDAVAERR